MKAAHRFKNVIVLIIVFMMMATGSFAQQEPDSNQRQAGDKTKPSGKYADVNGVHLYYEIHGSGQPLILIHGGLYAGSMFGANISAFAKVRKVIVVDLQGHGHTPDIDRPFSIEYMADDIAALIRYLKLGRCDILGHSVGAGVALQLAIRHPELVRRLVVVSAVLHRDWFYPEILAAQEQMNAGMAEQMKGMPMYELYHRVAPHPEDWSKLVGKLSQAMKEGLDTQDADVAAIKAKTLIVCGDADIFAPSHAVEMFGLLGGGKKDGGWDGSGQPESQLAILPGRTHYNLESDPALAETAIPFLTETEQKSGK